MSDEFPDFDEWDEASQEMLAEPESNPSDSLVEQVAEAARKKADQEHDQRDRLFKIVARSLIGALASSVLITGCYMVAQWGRVEASVVIGFNASVVVQTIGLAYIVARHLFPES